MALRRGGQRGQGGAAGGGSLQDRFKEMSAQERLIEEKKKEIELKLQEQKRKAQEEAISKMQAARSGKKPEVASPMARWVYTSTDSLCYTSKGRAPLRRIGTLVTLKPLF